MFSAGVKIQLQTNARLCRVWAAAVRLRSNEQLVNRATWFSVFLRACECVGERLGWEPVVGQKGTRLDAKLPIVTTATGRETKAWRSWRRGEGGGGGDARAQPLLRYYAQIAVSLAAWRDSFPLVPSSRLSSLSCLIVSRNPPAGLSRLSPPSASLSASLLRETEV